MKTMLKALMIFYFICPYPIRADVIVEWAIWDSMSSQQYGHGKRKLKAGTVTQVAALKDCFSFHISVYKTNETAARLESLHTGELRPVSKNRKVIKNIKSHCSGQTYSFSINAIPVPKNTKSILAD